MREWQPTAIACDVRQRRSIAAQTAAALLVLGWIGTAFAQAPRDDSSAPPAGSAGPPPTYRAPGDTRDPRATITFQIENDFFTRWAREDRDYTNGVRLGWLSGPVEMPNWLIAITTVPTFFGEATPTGAVRKWGFSIGQNIYTPEDTGTSAPIFDDRPYAGWSYAGFALQYIYTKDNEPVRLDTLQLDIGVVGPAAGGRQVQNNFHSLIGVDKAHGWENQLDNRVAVNLAFERRWRTGRFKLIEDPGLEVDFIPSIGASVGNVQVYGSVGGYMRIGNDLRNDFGPPRPAPSLPGSETFTANDDFGWYVFAGFQAQAVAYNEFIDRRAFHGGPDLDRRIITGDVSAGLAIIYRNIRVSYTHLLRAPEFKERDRFEQYGSITVSIRY